MTTLEKPKALRLADKLTKNIKPWSLDVEVAAELRRLHALNYEMLEALHLMCAVFLDLNGNHGSFERDAMNQAYAAIAKADVSV